MRNSWKQRRRGTRYVAVAAATIGLTGVAALTMPARATSNHAAAAAGPVVVLSDPLLSAAATPSGFTPAWVVSALTQQGVPAILEPTAAVPSNASVIVNPYGEVFPQTPAVQAALSAGAAWVNTAGVPFSMPNGQADATSPARYGVFAPPTPSQWFTGTTTTELGAALLPALPATSGDHLGWSIHAAAPSDERPLATYHDAAGIGGGPAITLITSRTGSSLSDTPVTRPR